MGFWQGASGGFDKGVGLGSSLYKDAMAQKELDANRKRQEVQDALAKRQFDMKLAEETPSMTSEGVFPGAPMPLTRAERARGLEKQMEIEAAKKAALEAKKLANGGNENMTPGRKAADMAFGKEYVDFNTMGRPTAEKGLSTLQEARQELVDKGGDLTGPIRGAMPDFIRAFTNPEAVAVKERIRGAVQNTLKSTLGAQFTEKEGERIFNNAYNDRLSPKENIDRLDKIIGELQGGVNAKENMGQYFEKKGTLTGYQGGAKAPGDMSHLWGD